MLIIIIVYSLCFGAVTALAANSRHRDPMNWFWIGLVFGVFGLIAVLVMGEESDEDDNDGYRSSKVTSLQTERTKKCPDCAEEIKYEAKVCRFCGKRFEIEQEKATAPLPIPQQSTIKSKDKKTERCPKCFTLNYETDRYCSSCGKEL